MLLLVRRSVVKPVFSEIGELPALVCSCEIVIILFYLQRRRLCELPGRTSLSYTTLVTECA